MKLLPFLSLLGALLVSASSALAEKITLRVGHFPNITHAQALVARALEREGKGWFQARLGADVDIQWYLYNAGPSAMEAIFARSLDLTYVGPGPVLNAYLKSGGAEIRVIAGAANGGAALVVQGDGRISKPADFKGRKIATPQLGGTQDITARVWLRKQGFRITQLSGEVIVLPTANPDQLALFKTGQLDGAWTVEPWVSRLELEGNGKVFLEQKDEITTLLASSVKILQERPELIKKFVAAHAELTQWINDNPAEAKRLVRDELKVLTKAEFPVVLTERAWPRLKFTSDISRAPLDVMLKDAQGAGFLKGTTDLSRLVVVP